VHSLGIGDERFPLRLEGTTGSPGTWGRCPAARFVTLTVDDMVPVATDEDDIGPAMLHVLVRPLSGASSPVRPEGAA